jgi:diguanylate cyclase (GGDEF)-like protein/putative nucleotidyltransferase with HDIG domain
MRSPFLSAALVGPLVAVALYQRSTYGALEAMRLAKTDPLTGLGNHRAFQEELMTDLDARRPSGERLALILVDVDNFKGINDRFGHQAGDTVLAGVAGILSTEGRSFRLGGDEFAVVIPLESRQNGNRIARALVANVGREAFGVATDVTISVGCAVFPDDAAVADELFGAADSALYHAKNAGRDQAQSYDPRFANLATVRRRSSDPAGFQAARALADAMEAADRLRDGHEIDDASPHSSRVADLAGRLAWRLGMSPGDVELVRLGGRLHDIGKLSVSVDLLTKPQPLDSDDWTVLREHPETGWRMLSSLGMTSIAEWVLHHHERWDGTGYPLGLQGDQIPLASRIIFVADAFDAMTSERSYQRARTIPEALAEARACAGAQFDPAVVDALEAELFEVTDVPEAAASVAVA